MMNLVASFISLMEGVTSPLQHQQLDNGWAVLPLVLVTATYLLPSIIAVINNKRPVSIAMINFLLGWTFIVWFVLLCWVTWKSAQVDTREP